jgi:hypothetical protein
MVDDQHDLDLVGAVVLWTVVRERNIEGEI